MSELYLTIDWNEVYCVKGMALKTNQKRCRRLRLSERDVSGMGCPSLWEHGMDALRPVPESSWQNLADRRHHQEVRETPVDLSVGLSRDIQTSWMCVYLCVCVCVCVCVCWLKACSRVVLRCKGRHKCRRGCVLSLSVRLGLVHFSAGPHLCLHPSVPPLSHQGQLLWAPSHSGAVSGWPLRNILGVFLECSVSLYNNQRAVEEVIIMVKHPGHKLSVSQYLRCTQKKNIYRYIAYIILSSGGLDVVSRKSKLF